MPGLFGIWWGKTFEEGLKQKLFNSTLQEKTPEVISSARMNRNEKNILFVIIVVAVFESRSQKPTDFSNRNDGTKRQMDGWKGGCFTQNRRSGKSRKNKYKIEKHNLKGLQHDSNGNTAN